MRKIFIILLIVLAFFVFTFNYWSLWALQMVAFVKGRGPINTNTEVAQIKPPYKDGSYTGAAEDAFYGLVQVKTVIHGGKITDVQFLQYPHDRTTSIAINTLAMPNLKREAIQAQMANVDIITGATQTSQAFMQSLEAALVQAK